MPGSGKTTVWLPIDVDQLPEESRIHTERIRLTLRAPNGATWDSGWDPNNVIGEQNRSSQPGDRLLPGKGAPYWLTASIANAFYAAHADSALDIHGTVAFTQLGPPQITVIREWNRAEAVAGRGVCSFSDTLYAATCAFPMNRPALLVFHLTPQEESARLEQALVAPPYRSFGIWNVIGSLAPMSPLKGTPRAPEFASVEIRDVVAHFEREFDLHGVRLQEFHP